MLKTTMSRFFEGLRLLQIQAILKRVVRQTIPVRTLYNLSIKTIARTEEIHNRSKGEIQQVIAEQGGYILHLDSTFEDEPPLLFVGKDGLSHMTLGAEFVMSESEANIKPILEAFRDRYGKPLAVVRDGSEGISKAIDSIFPDVPQVACQFHVLRNVGNVLFKDLYAEVASAIERLRIVPAITRLCKYLEPNVEAIPDKKQLCAQILYDKTLPTMKHEELLPLVTYTVGSWILRTKSKSETIPYPFDLPYLEMYNACETAFPRVHAYIRSLSEVCRMYKPLNDLETILKRVVKDEELSRKIGLLKRLSEVFLRIRAILRINRDTNILKHDPKWSQDEVSTARASLVSYLDRLMTEVSTLPEDSIRRRRCEKIVGMLRKEFDQLFVPNPFIEINGKRIECKLPRTNNLIERNFWEIIRLLTKLKGQKRVRKALHLYGKAVAILLNITNETYLKAVYPDGILNRLAQERDLPDNVSSSNQYQRPVKIPGRIPFEHVQYFIERSLPVVQRALNLPSNPPPPLSVGRPANGLLPP